MFCVWNYSRPVSKCKIIQKLFKSKDSILCVETGVESNSKSYMNDEYRHTKLCKSCYSVFLRSWLFIILMLPVTYWKYNIIFKHTLHKNIFQATQNSIRNKSKSAKEGIERSKLIWTMFNLSMRVSVPAVCVVLVCDKKQSKLGILTMVVINNWVILPITSTVPWLIPVCYLWVWTANYTYPNKTWCCYYKRAKQTCQTDHTYYLVQLTWQHLLLHNTKHLSPWKTTTEKHKQTHRHGTK